MTTLSRFRRSAKWLVLGAGLACLLVAALGVAPHEDGDGSNCLVCKVRHQPLEALAFAERLEAPPLRAVETRRFESIAPRSIVFDSSSPRAPPA